MFNSLCSTNTVIFEANTFLSFALSPDVTTPFTNIIIIDDLIGQKEIGTDDVKRNAMKLSVFLLVSENPTP